MLTFKQLEIGEFFRFTADGPVYVKMSARRYRFAELANPFDRPEWFPVKSINDSVIKGTK